MAAVATVALIPSAASAATPARCTVPQLAGSLKAGSPGAGQRYATLRLRNKSSRACSLFGYPGGQLLAKSGADIPTNIVRDRSRTPRTIVLRPGASAKTLLHWGAVAGTGDSQSGRCQPNPARFEVTPPNATNHLVLRWSLGPVCEKGRIVVQPMSL
ncbi:DUF4232 domain-containing protein [Conexibacter sp. JD483]|uniref:DUF4232 domain-containing protein n=1 Tax=unclassified Conexibacter TaxID=2627773 RepID=UPI0027254970|nr:MULTISPECIES: DUF4232 domain-containing protein [unclassified Conexibacter]MDO8184107.1 DUF4232 domain-containing protein [Conexibacter sp. CPCC 205706]MDO8197099.1 DUF4232 domain-containing protein [Conexibacter sp. CPCC 205762]MDR9367586.1 DUF4232 domain-containing protein [Conexibacter sp. JD483]